MNVTLNGANHELDDELTVAQLVQRHAESSKGVAVAVNAELVPKSAWTQHRLADGDRVELLRAAQGG